MEIELKVTNNPHNQSSFNDLSVIKLVYKQAFNKHTIYEKLNILRRCGSHNTTYLKLSLGKKKNYENKLVNFVFHQIKKM